MQMRKAAGIADEEQFVTQEFIAELEAEMLREAEALNFERAAQLRDRILEAKKAKGQTIKAGDENSAGFATSGNKRRNKKGRRRGTKGKRVPKPERP